MPWRVSLNPTTANGFLIFSNDLQSGRGLHDQRTPENLETFIPGAPLLGFSVFSSSWEAEAEESVSVCRLAFYRPWILGCESQFPSVLNHGLQFTKSIFLDCELEPFHLSTPLSHPEIECLSPFTQCSVCGLQDRVKIRNPWRSVTKSNRLHNLATVFTCELSKRKEIKTASLSIPNFW